jgi:hypothetical protein
VRVGDQTATLRVEGILLRLVAALAVLAVGAAPIVDRRAVVRLVVVLGVSAVGLIGRVAGLVSVGRIGGALNARVACLVVVNMISARWAIPKLVCSDTRSASSVQNVFQ